MTSEPAWELIVREPGRPHRKIRIAPGVILGRHPRCNCVLSDPSVSSKHAKIVDVGSGRLALEAFKTSNGTRVVGAGTIQPGQRHQLSGGAVLLLGASEIEVVAPPSPEPVRPPALDSQATMPQLAGDESTMASPDPPIQPRVAAPAPQPPKPSKPSSEPRAPRPPQPAPAPIPEPESRPVPVPAGPGEDAPVSSYAQTIDFQEDQSQGVARAALIAEAKPRLILDDEADRRVVTITKPEFVIGRDRRSDARIEHPGVSSPHVEIALGARQRFFIKDRGSRNGTWLNGEPLEDGVQRKLRPGDHVQIGPVDTLFLAEGVGSIPSIPDARFDAAGTLLVRDGVLTPQQLDRCRKAATAAGRCLAEEAVLTGLVTAEAMAQALSRATQLEWSEPARSSGTKWLAWAAAAIILALAVAVAYLILTRPS